MLAFDLTGAEFPFKQANRCLFCFSKLSWSAHNDKTFPVSEFNEAWSHLVPDEEIEFSVTPPVCDLCETTLKKLYEALMQLTEATISMKETVAKSGRNGSSLDENFAKLLEDLKQCGIEDRCRRGALALLEKLGHEEVFEEDYQAWFPHNIDKKDNEQTIERSTFEAGKPVNNEPDDYSPLNVYPSGDVDSDSDGAVELQSERRQTNNSGKLNGRRKRLGSGLARKSARRKDHQVRSEDNEVERGSEVDADPDYVLECDLCGETFLYPQYLSRHKKVVHNGIAKPATNHHKHRSPQVKKKVKSYLCRNCGKALKDRKSLWYHEKYTHEAASFACPLCGRWFKTRRSLVRHEGNKVCTRTTQGTLSGVTVQKYGKLRKDLETASTAYLPDVLQSDNKTPFVCDQCGKGFSDNCWLKRHQRQVHCLRKAPANATIVEESFPVSK